MNFNTNLQNLRKIHNLSQEQLAEKLDVSRQAVSKWENGVSHS
ncbi:helix-turn-helix transcriptional regulator [Anaerofustis stercorihominis]|uniref:XRE family transcriptional regulator n=1 Tax=Anaerofustis stercorihominis TaxID=214853 RepID=A0A3E3E1N1_9FIRM|nr:helix-turn-helix transcriptional regulator [Anaerofustis stercorihominis]RGD75185.1 XRE family transcriptional regulator [Anaerofustis stercorihominis]